MPKLEYPIVTHRFNFHPEIEKIKLDELVQLTYAIVKSFPGAENINFKFKLQPNIDFKADPKMIEQVLVNIYKNAIEVLDGHPSPEIWNSLFFTSNNRLQIGISDNGPGMKKEITEKIFIPCLCNQNKWNRHWIKLMPTNHTCSSW